MCEPDNSDHNPTQGGNTHHEVEDGQHKIPCLGGVGHQDTEDGPHEKGCREGEKSPIDRKEVADHKRSVGDDLSEFPGNGWDRGYEIGWEEKRQDLPKDDDGDQRVDYLFLLGKNLRKDSHGGLFPRNDTSETSFFLTHGITLLKGSPLVSANGVAPPRAKGGRLFSTILAPLINDLGVGHFLHTADFNHCTKDSLRLFFHILKTEGMEPQCVRFDDLLQHRCRDLPLD